MLIADTMISRNPAELDGGDADGLLATPNVASPPRSVGFVGSTLTTS